VASGISYFTYDMGLPAWPDNPVPTLLAELPFTGVTWSSRLNTPGAFSGTLNLNDPRMSPYAVYATTPGKTHLFVDINGTIVWGGIVWTRSYDNQDNLLQIGGSESWSYFTQRVQVQDYSIAATQDVNGGGPTYWATNPSNTNAIAAQVISDAVGVAGSIFAEWYRTEGSGPTSGPFYSGLINRWVNQYISVLPRVSIIPSYPIQQYQTIDSIITTLCQSGYSCGFDFAIDWAWSDGPGSTPIPTMNLHYPYRGRPTSVTGFSIDTELSVPYTYPEDATQMSDKVYGVASGTGGFSAVYSQLSSLTAGYPLLETVNTYSNINDPDSLTNSILDDLCIAQLPVPTPTFTQPLFSDNIPPDVVLMGDDVLVSVAPDPRFPYTSNVGTLRVTGSNVTVADEGFSTVVYTCTIPPGIAGEGPGNVSGGIISTGPILVTNTDTNNPSPSPPSPSPKKKNTYLSSLPAHSLTLVRWSVNMPTGITSTVDPDISLQMYPYIETQTAGIAIAGFGGLLGLNDFQMNLVGEVLLDSDHSYGHNLPYVWIGSSNIGTIAGTLTFMSWSNDTGGGDVLLAYAVYRTRNIGVSGVEWTIDSVLNSGYGYI